MGDVGTYKYDEDNKLIGNEGENVVLRSLYATLNPTAGPQADIVVRCRKIYDKSDKKRRRFHKLFEYYNDRMADLFVDDIFRPLMGRDTNSNWVYDRMCRESVTPILKLVNVVKKVVDRQATLYDEGPEREIEGNPKATEEYNEIALTLRLDAVMQMAERYQKLFRSAFLRPVIRNDEEGQPAMDLDLMLPTFVYSIPHAEDPTRAMAYFWLIYDEEFPDDPDRATWYYIDRARYFWWTYRAGGMQEPTAGSSEVAYISESMVVTETGEERPEGNMLGETGLVRVATDWVCGDVIPDPGDSLINFQDNVNLVETMKQNSLIFQAFPILHLSNFDIKDKDGNPRRFNIGPWNTIITQDLPGEATSSVEWVAPQANIEQFTKALEHDIDYFLMSQSIPKNLILDAATSGVALIERNRDIEELRKSYLNQYQSVEQELYRVIAKWANKWLDGHLPEDGKLIVKFKEPEAKATSEVEELASWKAKIELGVATARDYLREKNPDINDKAIDEKLAEIRKEKGDTGTLFSDLRARSGGIIGSVVSRAAGGSE